MIIIKYHEWLIFNPSIKETVFEICDKNYKKVRQITKQEAKDLIEEHSLRMVYRDKSGAIYK